MSAIPRVISRARVSPGRRRRIRPFLGYGIQLLLLLGANLCVLAPCIACAEGLRRSGGVSVGDDDDVGALLAAWGGDGAVVATVSSSELRLFVVGGLLAAERVQREDGARAVRSMLISPSGSTEPSRSII